MMQQLDVLKASFEDMERKGEVDLEKSLPVISDLSKRIKQIRDLSVTGAGSPEEIFELYYSSFVTGIVLDSISSRLKLSKVNKDNPKVALDSLAVLPYLKEMAFVLESRGSILDPLNVASNLQANATFHNLFKADFGKISGADKVLNAITEDIGLTH